MTDMEKVNVLYGMFADRLEKSPFGARQARVYREMLEFMSDCPTAEDAMKKIRNSAYYLAPGVALTEDTILAYRAAAAEFDMTDLVRVYDEKLPEIEADQTAIYDASYQERVKRERAAYLSTMEAFLYIFRAWETIRLGDPKDRIALNSSLNDLRREVARLKKPSASFTELAAIPAFRKMIPLKDEWYPVFVSETSAMLQGRLPEEPVREISADAFEDAWKDVEAHQTEIDEAGQRYLQMTREAAAVAHAPETADGNYVYTDERVR